MTPDRGAPPVVTGWSALSSLGTGADAFAAAVRAGRSGLVDVRGMFDGGELPRHTACAMPGFRARDHLGRKGTGYLDRSTALAVVAARLALADTDLELGDDNRRTTGVVLGTTAGSIRATSAYDRDTLTQDRPYLVDPMLFPTAVMNSAASRCAVWHRLHGVNATVAGGQLAGIDALRYGRTLMARGHADALLVGAVEEFSPHMAWGDERLYGSEPGRAPLGEGAVVLVAEDAERVRASGRSADAELPAVAFGRFAPPGGSPDPGKGLADCIDRALRQADVHADEVRFVATGERGIPHLDAAEQAGVDAVLGPGTHRLRIKELVGECHAAAGMFQLAALLALHRNDPALDGRTSVVTSVSSGGAVGAAVLRGFSRTRRGHAG
ncbi:hypothetical protein LKL35_16300 [Streptomyces sp. ET3-23]|uniref:beta-ketoacyl synthase N-terminal-like domain-containing protein n=1 Tax=Streptomyces sp. ET3-23 TaxID=2885643 RepID=UPI001D1020BB|nr:beta-ketoacyl synthase N-terminal-like domain-containing protein [Streptomyces sp. ET3-23]MCC2276961.1 hypothetical protein [Streptomyces sp. ET3-23]